MPQHDEPPAMTDTHVHLWDIQRSDLYWMTPDLTILQRSFTPEDLAAELRRVGAQRAVLVQAWRRYDENLHWLAVAEQHPAIAAVVGWVDLADPNVGAVLDEFARRPVCRGVRATAEDEPDPDWLGTPAVRRGIAEVATRDLALDVLVRTQHLHHVPRLAEAHPELRLCVDHLAKPPIASGDLAAWRARMVALAPYQNVVCKLSGLLTEAGPQPSVEHIKPVVEVALERFGCDRLMWGSDWPVCLLAADYRRTFDTLMAAVGDLPAGDRAALLGGAAARFYRL